MISKRESGWYVRDRYEGKVHGRSAHQDCARRVDTIEHSQYILSSMRLSSLSLKDEHSLEGDNLHPILISLTLRLFFLILSHICSRNDINQLSNFKLPV